MWPTFASCLTTSCTSSAAWRPPPAVRRPSRCAWRPEGCGLACPGNERHLAMRRPSRCAQRLVRCDLPCAGGMSVIPQSRRAANQQVRRASPARCLPWLQKSWQPPAAPSQHVCAAQRLAGPFPAQLSAWLGSACTVGPATGRSCCTAAHLPPPLTCSAARRWPALPALLAAWHRCMGAPTAPQHSPAGHQRPATWCTNKRATHLPRSSRHIQSQPGRESLMRHVGRAGIPGAAAGLCGAARWRAAGPRGAPGPPRAALRRGGPARAARAAGKLLAALGSAVATWSLACRLVCGAILVQPQSALLHGRLYRAAPRPSTALPTALSAALVERCKPPTLSSEGDTPGVVLTQAAAATVLPKAHR